MLHFSFFINVFGNVLNFIWSFFVHYLLVVFSSLKTIFEYISFTMLYYFQVYSNVNQFYIYIYPLFFRSFLIAECWVGFLMLYSRLLLVIYFICSCIYICQSQSPNLSLPSFSWYYIFKFYAIKNFFSV